MTTMGPKRKMEVYAVVDGYSPAPGIFSSWGHVHPLVTGFQNPTFRKCASVSEAKMYMENEGVRDYIEKIAVAFGDSTIKPGEKAYYAVANGRSPGIQEYYFGDGGTEPEVVKLSGACHKRFPTLIQAEQFIADWIDMYSCVCKELIKQELSRGFRPISANGDPIRFIKDPESTSIEGTVQCMLGEMRI